MSNYIHSIGHVNIITADNIEEAREMLPVDQAEVLVIGCKTWGIQYEGGQRGQMTRWPDRRGAVYFGAESIWGDWDHFGKFHADDDFGTFDKTGTSV